MVYEAVGFDPAANVLAPVVQSFLDARYPVGGQRVASSAPQDYIGTTAIDAPELSVTVNSPGSTASWLVMVTLDLSMNQANGNASTFVGSLLVDGVGQPSQIIADYPTAYQRATAGQTYLVSGLAAGSHTMKITGNLTTTGKYTLNVQHSTMTVIQVS